MPITFEESQYSLADKFQTKLAQLVDTAETETARLGLPTKAFDICHVDDDLKDEINNLIHDEFGTYGSISDAYDAVADSDRDDQHALDFGEISEEMYQAYDRERGDATVEIGQRREIEMNAVSDMSSRLPGVLTADSRDDLYDELSSMNSSDYNAAMSSMIAEDERNIASAIYTPENYFTLADGAEDLTRATSDIRRLNRKIESGLDDEALADANMDLAAAEVEAQMAAKRMAPIWYVEECFNGDHEGESPEAGIDRAAKKIQDIATHDGYNGLMTHIDNHMFYEMPLRGQLSVIDTRFQRNESVNVNLIDACINDTKVKYASANDYLADDSDDAFNHAQLDDAIDAAHEFSKKYPDVLKESSIRPMIDLRNYQGSNTSEFVAREMAHTDRPMSDGFPDFSEEYANEDIPF